MDKVLRTKFNSEFNEKKYVDFIADINHSTKNNLDFKVCETPLFLTNELMAQSAMKCQSGTLAGLSSIAYTYCGRQPYSGFMMSKVSSSGQTILLTIRVRYQALWITLFSGIMDFFVHLIQAK